MRKQYHFRPSDRGLLAWDVDRLIELSRGLPQRRVARAVLEGRTEIEALQFERDPEPDYVGRRPSELPY